MKRCLVTGSSGLIGSEVVTCFSSEGWEVHGMDNNMRREFLGPAADTTWNRRRLQQRCPLFHHHETDIRDRSQVLALMQEIRPRAIVHTAAQPSHELAASRPFDDFDVNAGGTLNLLEAARRTCPESPFIHMSTNKVYGEAPNRINLVEKELRWDYADPEDANGIKETLSIDQSMHSIYGASKMAADMMVQEYGRYFEMPTCCLRAGCMTGPNHSAVELHGFLSYLIRCNLAKKTYKIFGYGGKQVRDEIHSYDVVQFMHQFVRHPRCAAVYNIGGGRDNSISILEAFALVQDISGIEMSYKYCDEHRKGDHICYISDLSRIKEHYPHWKITKDLKSIFVEIYGALLSRLDVVWGPRQIPGIEIDGSCGTKKVSLDEELLER